MILLSAFPLLGSENYCSSPHGLKKVQIVKSGIILERIAMFKSALGKLKLILLLGVITGVLPTLNIGCIMVAEENPEPVFFITILGPNSGPCADPYAIMLADVLPKIGVGIETLDLSQWELIAPRTWNYPGPYPIPNYTLGGYDILSLGIYWGLDWNPSSFYSIPFICGKNNNFYQYYSEEMDLALWNYITTVNYTNRLFWGKKIQEILYKDVPLCPVLSINQILLHDPDLAGWDPNLFWHDFQSMANWSLPSETAFYIGVPLEHFGNFYPFNISSAIERFWLNQVYNSLLKHDPTNYFYMPHVATSFNVSTDGETITVSLNPAVVWADGTPLNASDVAFSFNLAMNSTSTKSSQVLKSSDMTIYYIITILDEYTLEITSRYATYAFPESCMDVFLLPKHIWSDVAPENLSRQAIEWAKTDPTKLLGAGPFYLYEYNATANIIHLKRNPYYASWSGVAPNFEDIYLEFFADLDDAETALANEEIDLIYYSYDPYYLNLSTLPVTVGYTLFDSTIVQEFAINNKHPIMGTGDACPIAGSQSAKYVRKAISHVIDRELMCQVGANSLAEPAATTCPRLSPVFDSSLKPPTYNLEIAKEYLRKAGFGIPYPRASYVIGLTFPIFVSLLALLGGCYTLLHRRLK